MREAGNPQSRALDDETAGSLADDRGLIGALQDLAGVAGVDFIQSRRVLCELCEIGQGTIGGLVEATRVPHRTVIDTLRAVRIETQGDVAFLPEEKRNELADRLRCCRLKWLDSIDRIEDDPTLHDLVPLVNAISAGLPPPVWNLDHVSATTETKLRRALYLASHYELDGSHLLCLGDHDLTSVVTKLVAPELRVSVVDIDERLLEYLDNISEQYGLGIHLEFGDLRLGLPVSLRVGADLVFTDPPYTSQGIELFVRRALEGLVPTPRARLLFCYGVNEWHLNRVLTVQRMLHRLRLTLEALLPRFNTYRGAHAIGASSSLWVCRATRRTWMALDDFKPDEARIYSRGKSSEESSEASVAPEIRELVEREVSLVTGSVGLVGVGWEGLKLHGAVRRMSIHELLDSATELPGRIGARRWPDLLLINFGRFYGDSLPRALMAVPATSRLLVVVDNRALQATGVRSRGPIRRLVEARFAIKSLLPGRQGQLSVLAANPRPERDRSDADHVFAYLQDHQGAKLRNAWREALVDLAARNGGSLTKNEARSLIDRGSFRDLELDSRMLELPLHRLKALVDDIDRAVAQVLERSASLPRSENER